MEISRENLFILIANAINDGNCEELLEFLCNSGDEQYLDSVINKMRDAIKEILSKTLSSQSKITNILSIILGLADIAMFGPEKSEYLTRCLLSIAVDKRCSIYNLKHVLTMLKTFFTDEHIMEWSSDDESLFVPLKLLGVKLTGIGDYEGQSILLETLWQVSNADRNFWADMWFSNQKTRIMFLSLNADQFVLDCRKFLNCVNRNEINQKTFAFVATSVSLGSIQLRKPYGSDFWIDFNYDTESISFFCSSLNLENEKTWETIFISADMVEGYCIRNKKSLKTKELCVTLKCACSQLLALEDTSIDGLESQLIRMRFWSFLDIHHHTEAIFKRNCLDTAAASGASQLRKVSDCAEVVSCDLEKVSDLKHLKQKRRVSESIDLVCFTDQQESQPAFQNEKQRRASEPIELLCASYPEERVASSEHNKLRRASESTELVCSSYPQELRTELHKCKRRRVSESTTLISAVDLLNENVNNIETEIHIPDYDIRKRKYTHCKKVSVGFVDSEEFNQDVHHTNDYLEEEIIGLQSCSNAMDSRKTQNLMSNQEFSDGNEIEKGHNVEFCGNDNDGVDVENNLSLLKGKNKKSIEINSPCNDLQNDNASEVYTDEKSLLYQNSSGRHRKSPSITLNIVGDHNLYPAQYNNVNENDNKKCSATSSGYKTVEKGEYIKSYKVHDSLHNEGQFELVEELNSMNETSLNGSSQPKPKRMRNLHLLELPNLTQRKSPQVFVNGCSQSMLESSQNAQFLAASNMSKRKSSQVSIGGCLQSTPKRSQNEQFADSRKSPQSVSDLEDMCAISPTPLNKKNNTIPKILTSRTQKLTNPLSDHVNEKKSSKKFAGISTRLSLRSSKNPAECNTTINTSSNSLKKKRLYNINRAPVYDVPPSEKKVLNDSDENNNPSASNSLSPKESVDLNELTNKELCSDEKATKVLHPNVEISKAIKNSVLISENNETELKSLSPIIDKTNHVQSNVSPEKSINDLLAEENGNDFEFGAETEDYQKGIDMEYDSNIDHKKHKIILGKKNKHEISRGENSIGPTEAHEIDNALTSVPQKKRRRAAVMARKRNKLILEQKGSETSFDGSQHTKRQNKVDFLSQETEEYDAFAPPSSDEKELLPCKRNFFESDKLSDKVLRNNASKSVKRSKSTKMADVNSGKIDGDEYTFSTPPPLVKRRRHKHSIFVTDTETGSSEVSWFSKSKLFDTPQKSYSNWKKINEARNQVTKKNIGKPKIRKANKNLKSHRTSSQRSKASDSESRSKSAFSELERFSLVIEKNKYISLPANDLSGLYHAFDSDRHLRQSSIEDDDFQQNYSFEDLDVDNEREKSAQLNEDSNSHVSEYPTLNNSFKKAEKTKCKIFPSSTSAEVSNITIEPNNLLKNKKNMKSTNGLGKNKNSRLTKELSNDKKMLADKTMLKYSLKENKSVEYSLSNNLDILTLSENRHKNLKDSLRQELKKNLNTSIAISHSTSNKSPNILPNLPIALDTLTGVSPIGRWMSPNKILENQYERPIPECKNTLIEESLSPMNDEKQGKKMHLMQFLESLSSASTNPQTFGVTEVIDVSGTMEKSKTKPSIKMSAKKHFPSHSMCSENIVNDHLTKQNQQSSEMHYTDLLQEYDVGCPSLQSKSSDEIEEEEHYEKEVSNKDPIESPFQAPLSMFRKTQSKMSSDDHLPRKPSVLHILSDEVNTLTHKLFSTLKKCMSDFREKMVALRESIANTANRMIANESKLSEKNLQALARNCRESRIHIQKHLKILYSMGMEYFESEKRLERRLEKKHKKAVLKYTKSLQIAQSIAEKALEERFILKSRAFLKIFLKQMKLV